MTTGNKKSFLNPNKARLFANDPQQLYDYERAREVEGLQDSMMNTFTDGIFKAVCLGGIRTEDNTTVAVDINDAQGDHMEGTFTVPVCPWDPDRDVPLPWAGFNPAAASNAEEANFAISVAKSKYTAMSDFTIDSQDAIQFGQILDCYFEFGSLSNSNARSIRFLKPPSVTRESKKITALATIEGVNTAMGSFEGSMVSLLGAGGIGGSTAGFLYPGARARFVVEADRKIGDIKHIVMHSTAGSDKPGAAKRTIESFAKGMTHKYKYNGRENWTLEELSALHPDEYKRIGMNDDYIVHPTRKVIEKLGRASIHYATDKGGAIFQGVAEKDIAQHAGSRSKASIGIEMCGSPWIGPGKGANGIYSAMYTDAHLNTVAKLCAEICHRWQLQPDRKTIIGHEEFKPTAKIDPGENVGITEFGKKYGEDTKNYWNWSDFMKRVVNFYNSMPPTTLS